MGKDVGVLSLLVLSVKVSDLVHFAAGRVEYREDVVHRDVKLGPGDHSRPDPPVSLPTPTLSVSKIA